MRSGEPTEAEVGHPDLRDLLQLFRPVYDPPWLRRSHPRCLWDGRVRPHGSEFCGVKCKEHYVDWEHFTSHGIVGREPTSTFFEQDQRS